MLHEVYEVTRTYSVTKTIPLVMKFRTKNGLNVGFPAEFYGRLSDNKILKTAPLVFSHQLSVDSWEIKAKDGSAYKIRLIKE